MAASHRVRRAAAIAMLVAVAVAAALGPLGGASATASTWAIVAMRNTGALARSIALQPPGTVTASCTAPLTARTITVSWNGVSHATSYNVYVSTTSSTAGFAVVATGVTTTTWTSGTLKNNTTYWYAVAAVAGAPAWVSVQSAPTAGHTIGGVPRCL